MLARKPMSELWDGLIFELDNTVYIHRTTPEEAEAIVGLYKAAQLALEALLIIEWTASDDIYDMEICPTCRRLEKNGHKDDCEIAIAITALKTIRGVKLGER